MGLQPEQVSRGGCALNPLKEAKGANTGPGESYHYHFFPKVREGSRESVSPKHPNDLEIELSVLQAKLPPF